MLFGRFNTSSTPPKYVALRSAFNQKTSLPFRLGRWRTFINRAAIESEIDLARAPPRYGVHLNPSATDSGSARRDDATISRALIAFPRRPHATNTTQTAAQMRLHVRRLQGPGARPGTAGLKKNARQRARKSAEANSRCDRSLNAVNDDAYVDRQMWSRGIVTAVDEVRGWAFKLTIAFASVY